MPFVIRSFEHHAGDSTFLARFHPNFDVVRTLGGGGQGPPASLSLPATTREDSGLDGYLEYPHTVKALYICKHPCLLRDSNPGVTEQQSVSLTTIPDG
ncbi:uncharacterized protein TNCV_3230701 [Trichonephila clavipes]|nr:uncharacterized protein TNCV_3230701 [Trichonephila clavipes]